MLTALKFRDFRYLYIGQVTSSMGNALFRLSLFWLLTTLTDHLMYLSLLGLAMTLPVIFQSITGVFVDRVDRLRLMVVIDFIRMILIFALIVLVIWDALHPVLLICAFCIIAFLGNMFETSYYAYFPGLLPESYKLNEQRKYTRLRRKKRAKRDPAKQKGGAQGGSRIVCGKRADSFIKGEKQKKKEG